jgi:pimeloyl-ACP methyl ester carboxylesterase
MESVEYELDGAEGRVIRGDAYVHDDARAAVILCHGFQGFARGGFFPYLRRQLAEAGLNVIAFDFSGSGIGPDRETFTELEAFERNTFSKELYDLGVVWDEAERRGWAARPTGLLGFSRGGGIAILHAVREPRARALVTIGSVATFDRWRPEFHREWRGSGFREVENTRTKQVLRIGTAVLDEIEQRARGDYSVQAAASLIHVPWLIVHGTADETIPVHEARQLHTASEGRAELMLVERASHAFNFHHGDPVPTPELRAVVDRTSRFFTANLA